MGGVELFGLTMLEGTGLRSWMPGVLVGISVPALKVHSPKELLRASSYPYSKPKPQGA